jgi:isopentenyl-diphosphate delta-isomerase type 1
MTRNTSEEQLILVDERNRAAGSAGKTAIHRAGLLHRAFSIFVVDARGRIVVQQRSPDKYHSGGLWANSCCGHPRRGERTIAAVLSTRPISLLDEIAAKVELSITLKVPAIASADPCAFSWFCAVLPTDAYEFLNDAINARLRDVYVR